MPSYPGVSYQPKVNDHMDKVLTRACAQCGAKVGELCVMASGKPVTKVAYVHALRLGKKRNGRYY